MKFKMIVKSRSGMVFDEIYNFPVKTIKGATKHAQQMIDDFNIEERRRYGKDIGDRILIGVTFAEKAEV